MYETYNTFRAHVLGACFMPMLCIFSESVFRIAFSSFGFWLVLCLCPLGQGPPPLRILV